MKIQMKVNKIKYIPIAIVLMATVASCNLPTLTVKNESRSMPETFNGQKDTANTAYLKWSVFFKDSFLVALIDTALKNNQELNVLLQEVDVAKNGIRAKKGAYLPFLDVGAGAGVEKVGRYTSQGASDANTDIKPGVEFPEPLPNYVFGAEVSWEVDIWKKLRNSKQVAVKKYLSTIEGKNFMVTHLISEIASSYYELIALDNQLDILGKNIEIQKYALELVRLEKQAAKVTELAVTRFEAEVLKNQSRQFYIKQQIIEAENKINFLLGRFPQPVARRSDNFLDLKTDSILYGVPSQLLENRPDIRRAELELAANKLEVKVAKAEFYPRFVITAGAGYEAFNPKYLVQTPQSMLYSIAGGLVAPLVNRNAIKSAYLNANARQIQSVYEYEKTVLSAHIEVVNMLSRISNLQKSFDLKIQQVDALSRSVDISTRLFNSARAEYTEVLFTQRDALDSKFELIETKQLQMNAMIGVYKALGGGWR
jgi:outer membrane protein, multidrug efflux system